MLGVRIRLEVGILIAYLYFIYMSVLGSWTLRNLYIWNLELEQNNRNRYHLTGEHRTVVSDDKYWRNCRNVRKEQGKVNTSIGGAGVW